MVTALHSAIISGCATSDWAGTGHELTVEVQGSTTWLSEAAVREGQALPSVAAALP